MQISKEGIDLIKQFEGCRLTAYQDVVGVWTIGYGITNACKSITGLTVRKGLTITQAKADEMLKQVISAKYAKNVLKYDYIYHWNQNQFDALCSYAYNIGSIDSLVKKGKRTILEISADIPNHNKAKGRVLPGLTRRRAAEKALFDKKIPILINIHKPANISVNKVISVAQAEVGYLEKKSNRNLDNKTANAGYNNYTKYGRDMHKIYPQIMDFPAPWCDCFVDWCFYKAYGVSTARKLLNGNFDDYTVASAQMYKKKGAWYKTNPKKGDQIFFTNSRGGICHTGLVYMVDAVYVYTIEGNTSGAGGVVANGGGVFKKKYSLNYSRIAGYGRPNYSSAPGTIIRKPYQGKFPELPSRGYFKNGDRGDEVKNLQVFLNWYGNYGLITDGILGSKTIAAVKDFQACEGLVIDGEFGEKSLEKARMMPVCK